MSELKPCPRETEALDIIESMLDVADMKCTGPLYADDPPRSGMCRIPEQDAAILRQYIALRRSQPDNSRFADCHIWETGDNLNTISDKCEVLIKADDIKALIAHPANEPLTLEHMDCKTCQFEDRNPDEEPCRHCKGAYPSRYRRKPEGSEQ